MPEYTGKKRQFPVSDCGDVIALTEGDSGCHGCQAARPGADQTAGYGRERRRAQSAIKEKSLSAIYGG